MIDSPYDVLNVGDAPESRCQYWKFQVTPGANADGTDPPDRRQPAGEEAPRS